MLELFVRLLIALTWSAAAWLNGSSRWMDCVLLASTGCLVSLATHAAVLKGRRNSGGAGILASADAAWISFALASTGHLVQFGFLVLAPVAYAAARFGSLPTAMAPLAASSLALAFAVNNPGKEPSASFYGQMAAVLMIGLLLNHRRIVVTECRPLAEAEVEAAINHGPAPEAYMELRESFRRLKDQYRDMASLRRRDVRTLDMLRLLTSTQGTFPDRLARSIRQTHNLRAVAVFQPSPLCDKLSLSASDGNLPETIERNGLSANLQLAQAQVQDSVSRGDEEALRAHTPNGSANVPLIHEGKVIGLLSLFGETPQLSNAIDACSDASSDLAIALAHDTRFQSFRRRALSAETQLELSSTIRGSASRNHLAARTAMAIEEICDIENIAVVWLHTGEKLLAATVGSKPLLPDALSLGAGRGIEGWATHGAPDLWMPSTHQDSRARTHDVIQTRQHSAALLAVRQDEELVGYISVSSPRSGAIGAFEYDTIRLAALHLGQAISQLEGERHHGGIAPLSELREALSRNPASMVVQLVPVQRERQAQALGIPAMQQATRAFAQRLSAKLPPGALIAARAGGEFLVLLPGLSRRQAESWANESAAMASLVGIPVGDGTSRVPLAFRARVSSGGLDGDMPQEPPEPRELPSGYLPEPAGTA